MGAVSPSHPRWAEFADRLSGPEGCDFQEEPDFTWRCKGGRDKTFAREILAKMGFDEDTIELSLSYYEDHGGYCDCEILFNIDPREEDSLD